MHNSQIDSPLKDPNTKVPEIVAKIMSRFPAQHKVSPDAVLLSARP